MFQETKTGFSNGETILLLHNHQSRIAQNDTVPFETLFERILTQADQTSTQNISQTIYRGSSYIKRHHAILSYLDQSKT